MRLVDTSVWIAFWRGDRSVVELERNLDDGEVLLHPWVLGEIALGNLGRRRDTLLHDLAVLPAAPLAAFDEVMALIARHSLAATGLGWVDVNLLASARLASAELWTIDQRLARAWHRMA